MLLNRATKNIPIDEKSISKVIYGESCSGPFVSPNEIKNKTSFSKDYSKRIPGVDYKSFGKKIDLD